MIAGWELRSRAAPKWKGAPSAPRAWRHDDRATPGAWLSMATYFAALAGHYLVPSSMEPQLALSVGGVQVLFVECGTLLLFALNRRIANPALFWWGVIGLAYGVLSGAIVGRHLTLSVVAALELYGPLVLLGVVPLGEAHRTPLRLMASLLLALITLEVLLYASGILAYDFDTSHTYGELDRIWTTAGSPTATAAVVFMLGAWCLDLWGPSWKSVASALVAVLGIALTFSRGPMLMAGALALALMVAWIAAAAHGGVRVRRLALAAVASCAIAPAAPWTAEKIGLSAALAERLQEGTADAGRLDRFDQAWQTFTDAPLGGVGTGHYYHRLRHSASALPPAVGTSPHNVYLLTFAESGLLGGLIYAGGLAHVLVRVARRWRTRPAGSCVWVIALGGLTIEALYVEAQFGLLLAGLLAWFDRRDHRDGAGAP